VAKILAAVGKAGPAGHGATIHGHANAIDCSPLLNGVLGSLLTPITDLLATLGLVPPGAPGTSNECNK